MNDLYQIKYIYCICLTSPADAERFHFDDDVQKVYEGLEIFGDGSGIHLWLPTEIVHHHGPGVRETLLQGIPERLQKRLTFN